jgi:cell division protein FtsB
MPRTSKRQHAKRVGEYLLASGLSVLFLVLLWAVWGIARKEEIARSAVDDRKSELAVLSERKAVFEDNLAELSTERGQEATLRQNHGVARAGEEVIIVVPPKEDELDPYMPWYKRLLGWFGVW